MTIYGPQLCLVVTFCCCCQTQRQKTKTNEKKTFTLFVIVAAEKRPKKSVKNFISIFYVAVPLPSSLPFPQLKKYEQIMSLENLTSSLRAAGQMQME